MFQLTLKSKSDVIDFDGRPSLLTIYWCGLGRNLCIFKAKPFLVYKFTLQTRCFLYGWFEKINSKSEIFRVFYIK